MCLALKISPTLRFLGIHRELCHDLGDKRRLDLQPQKERRRGSRQQEGVAEGFAQKEIALGLGKDSKGSKQEQALAEGISQKEIDIGLRKAGPEPTAEEKGLAEGIAKKEIAIDTGKDESTRSWFGGKKAKPSSKPQPSEVSCLSQ